MSENKKYPIGGYAPGNYSCTCCICKADFMCDKRAVQCEPCAEKMVEQSSGKDYAHIHVNLPSGGIATVSPDASPELLGALNKMVELAKDIPSPEKEGGGQEMPEEIAQWIEQEVQRQTIDFEKWHGVDQISAGGFRIGAKKLAFAVYHKLMEGNTEAYWFEKAREVLVERNDFKGQLSEMTRMRDVAKTEYERWKKESDDLSAILAAKNLENAQLKEALSEMLNAFSHIGGVGHREKLAATTKAKNILNKKEEPKP